ncbi:hypothetical protein PITC_086800 [Penicillium italicum]|uniref:Uncharacterized protein n=1 Tax=Penicillium italicum TaxID=40296 RepID=A0A0A2K8R2_PENIT|nr:hypothetical protein PITC_086800 [Penicillium italicum]
MKTRIRRGDRREFRRIRTPELGKAMRYVRPCTCHPCQLFRSYRSNGRRRIAHIVAFHTT